jgi:hypothetical protein
MMKSGRKGCYKDIHFVYDYYPALGNVGVSRPLGTRRVINGDAKQPLCGGRAEVILKPAGQNLSTDKT